LREKGYRQGATHLSSDFVRPISVHLHNPNFLFPSI
jgi:hypothetical protein